MTQDTQYASEILYLFPTCGSWQDQIFLTSVTKNSKDFYHQFYCILLENYHISISGYINCNSEVEWCNIQPTLTPEYLFSSLIHYARSDKAK